MAEMENLISRPKKCSSFLTRFKSQLERHALPYVQRYFEMRVIKSSKNSNIPSLFVIKG